MLTIIATMDHELAPLRRVLQSGSPSGAARTPSGAARRSPTLQPIGMGRKRSQTGVRALLASINQPSGPGDSTPDGLLLLGFAGALDPALRPGELSLPTRYYLAQPESAPADFLEPDKMMWRQAVAAVTAAGVPVSHQDSLTLDHLAATPEAKTALRQQYQVGVVNMEDYWVAQVARDAGVPFLSARAVLDTADQGLPSYLLGLAQHRAGAVLSTVAMPWRLPTLLRLARQMRRAQHTLGRFGLSFIYSMYGREEMRSSTLSTVN